MTIDNESIEKSDNSRPSSSLLACNSFILECDSSTPINHNIRLHEEEDYHLSLNSSYDLDCENTPRESKISSSFPEFEDVFGLEQKIEEMSARKQKQFVFLHSIVNSSSDDSQLSFSEESTDSFVAEQPLSEMYNFQLLEAPIPLPELPFNDNDLVHKQLRAILMVQRQVSYSIPIGLKHLLCTDDNLMGFEDNITLERIVRRKLLADTIPMCSQGLRTFSPLRMDFSPTHIGQDNIINISDFIQKLSDKFQPRINSFFNTRFQLSYTFEDGKFEILYGIFEDHNYFAQKTWNSNYIDLHVFSRYLSKDYLQTEADDIIREISGIKLGEREWKSFVTMEDIFSLVDYLLKGKSSFIQGNSHMLKHIKNGRSLKSAAEKYELSVEKNKHRILSNVKKFIEGKRIVPANNLEELATTGQFDRDFHCSLFDQVMGYYSDLGLSSFQESDGMYVIELRHFEDVIRSISDKYVYEKYVFPAPSVTIGQANSD